MAKLLWSMSLLTETTMTLAMHSCRLGSSLLTLLSVDTLLRLSHDIEGCINDGSRIASEGTLYLAQI
jgi:hypothetical protein